MFERKIISKKEKILDQENSQLIIQSLDFSQGLQSDLNAKVSDVAYNQSTWNAVTTIAPSKNTVRDKFESLGAAGSDKGTLTCRIFYGGGTTFNNGYYGLTSTGFWISTTFRITANMDATADMKIIISCRERAAATDPSGTYSIGATKTDGTEAFQTNNIANATAWSVGGSPNLRTISITIANAGIDVGDLVYFYLVTGSDFDLDVFDVSIEYTEA